MTKVKMEPAEVFACFAEINKIPRPSKKEEKMIEFLKNYGEKLGLETKVDEVGNVIIRKPATKGYEDRETTVIQSHTMMRFREWQIRSSNCVTDRSANAFTMTRNKLWQSWNGKGVLV